MTDKKSRWCSYADWSQVASLTKVSQIKKKITGIKKWKPNQVPRYVHTLLRQATCIIDFGCGLGRNLPLLLSPECNKVIGVDIPKMVRKLQEMDKPTFNQYSYVTSNLGAAFVIQPKATVFFESVVFQHLRNKVEIKRITQLLCNSSVTTVLMLWNAAASIRHLMKQVIKLLKSDFPVVHKFLDSESFPIDHILVCMQKEEQ